MTFLSAYRALIKPASNWCDNLYNESLKHADPSKAEAPENSSVIGQLEAEVLGRFVCLGTIATGTVLIPIDIVLTALIGVGAVACAVAQRRGLYTDFKNWRKDTEIEVLFLMMTINSVASLFRSIYWNEDPDFYDTETSLKSLLRLSQKIRKNFANPPIYSRTSAIGQLFFSAPLAKTGLFAVGCLSALFNGITLGYFRKKLDGVLTTALPSLFLFAPISLAFHTISCLIHLAKPATKHLVSLFKLQDEKTEGNYFTIDDRVMEAERSLCPKKPFLQPYRSSKPNCPKTTWVVNNFSKSIVAVVLIHKGPDGTFAVKEGQIVLAKMPKKETSDKSAVMKCVLGNGDEVQLHEAEEGYLVSDDSDYAVLGSDEDGNFILGGSITQLVQNQSTMHKAPLNNSFKAQIE